MVTRVSVDRPKANVPDLFWTCLLLAASFGQRGEVAAARKALDDLLARKEDFAETGEKLLGKWFEPSMSGHLMAGLRKAGLGGS